MPHGGWNICDSKSLTIKKRGCYYFTTVKTHTYTHTSKAVIIKVPGQTSGRPPKLKENTWVELLHEKGIIYFLA